MQLLNSILVPKRSDSQLRLQHLQGSSIYARHMNAIPDSETFPRPRKPFDNDQIQRLSCISLGNLGEPGAENVHAWKGSCIPSMLQSQIISFFSIRSQQNLSPPYLLYPL